MVALTDSHVTGTGGSGERRKGCWTARDLARRVRKIAISDRLTPREISLFPVRGGEEGEAALPANGNGDDLVLRIVNDHCPRIRFLFAAVYS